MLKCRRDPKVYSQSIADEDDEEAPNFASQQLKKAVERWVLDLLC
jgi:hypothetical protein